MKKLRHVSGSNLKQLEAQVEQLSKEQSLALLGVTQAGSNWYVHFTIDSLGSGTNRSKKKRVSKPKQTEILRED